MTGTPAIPPGTALHHASPVRHTADRQAQVGVTRLVALESQAEMALATSPTRAVRAMPAAVTSGTLHH